MRKGNNKPSREQRIQQNQKNTKSSTFASPDSLEMQHIIAQAIVEADMIKEQRQNAYPNAVKSILHCLELLKFVQHIGDCQNDAKRR